VATDAAIALLGLEGRRAPALGDAALAALRADVHLVGWLLALEGRAGAAVREVLGPGRAALAPPTPDPASLLLEQGVRAHEFLATDAGGRRGPVARFAPLRPDAAVEIESDGSTQDLLVLTDGPGIAARLEAAEHLLAGWWRSLPRYVRQGGPPRVVVLCRSDDRADAVLAQADALLGAALARIGVAEADWQRPGRDGICVAVEAALHGGDAAASAVPALPPERRAGAPAAARSVQVAPLPARAAVAAAKPPWR